MKKIKISVAAILLAGSSLTFSSCIGSFALTNSVLDWNKGIGSKVVNELVFIAFWILPVYEVTGLADLLVLNSIEFWSGKNPATASVKTVELEGVKYEIASDNRGYKIINKETGQTTELLFDAKEKTWNVVVDNKILPFMTFVDDSHVKMITPNGDFREIELSQQGVNDYQEIAGSYYMAGM